MLIDHNVEAAEGLTRTRVFLSTGAFLETYSDWGVIERAFRDKGTRGWCWLEVDISDQTGTHRGTRMVRTAEIVSAEMINEDRDKLAAVKVDMRTMPLAFRIRFFTHNKWRWIWYERLPGAEGRRKRHSARYLERLRNPSKFRTWRCVRKNRKRDRKHGRPGDY